MLSVYQSVQVLSQKVANFPEVAVVLGSGWNALLEQLDLETEISYEELFEVKATVPGHAGKLVIGSVGGKRIACMAGRFHTYEGYTTEQATRPLQAMAQAGLKKIIVTAAAGALNEHYQVGDFVILEDVITAFCPSPLPGADFVDMSQVFSASWRKQALRVCAANGIPHQQGVYVYVRGPHFETPADKMLYRHLGADAIGMSTVPETIMAQKLGVEVLGIAYVTNLAFVVHDHKDVLAAANAGSRQMVTLLQGVI